MRSPSCFLAALALVVVPVFASCGTAVVNPCDQNPNGPGCLGTCTGQCVPDATPFGLFLVLLWSGPDGTAPPECPSETGGGGLLGYLDTPPDATTCNPECSCSPSSGNCFPPSMLTASSGICPGSGTGTPIGSPEAWSGACAPAAVASAASVTIEPPGIGTVHQCAPPFTQTPTITGGKTRALRCGDPRYLPAGECPLATQAICAFPDVEGFALCLWGDPEAGDTACPPDWPVKHLYFDDANACACTCADPVGDFCSTTMTVFGDGACSKPLASTTVSSNQPPMCVPVAPGSTLGGMTATSSTYHSGACAPVLDKNPVSTMCCRSP
jgi:hypothetical protein